ncbi:uncharacterized protein [Montipora capricornis]|uniref:uncharacterized protein isoform X1 n=1 Tax=Montipora capricornis TaxID=246305 RepID=UPI0035F1A4C2
MSRDERHVERRHVVIQVTAYQSLRRQAMYPGNREGNKSRRIPFIAYLFATLILEVSATSETRVNMNNSSRCIQAVPAVSTFSRNNSCIFYKYTLDGFCKGIITSLYIFGDQGTIEHGERETKTFENFYKLFHVGEKCGSPLTDLYCRYHFPSCDTTLEKPRKRRICRRSCNHVLHVLCKREVGIVRQIGKTSPNYDHATINCSTYPVASGGDGPECYQSSSLPDDDTRSTDCYHGIGVGYRGNVNLTQSGRTCQRWTAQCPHRHWRIPEDVDTSQNDSNNMCRNPDGSAPDGPWCYTTDPNMRWEYCNISQCPPRVPRKIPTLPDGFAFNATTIYLSWEAIPTSFPSGKEPLLGYRVRYQRLGSPLYDQVNVSSNVTEISLTNLTPQTKYKIEVHGFNAIGHGAASTAIIIKTLQSGLVTVDITLHVELGEKFRDDVQNRNNSSSFVTLKYNIERMINAEFNNSSDFKVYSLRMKNFRSDDLQADLLILVIINANTTSKSEAVARLIEGLRPAKDLGITSIFVVGKPQPPENVRAADVQKWYFVVTWQQPKYGVYYQIDNFTIERKKGTAASFTVLETLPYEKTRINVKDLEPATEYTMRLSSNNKYGRSSAILLKQTTLPDKFLLKLMVTIVLPFGLAILFITIVCVKFGPPCKCNVEDKSQIEIELPLKGGWREFPRLHIHLEVKLGEGAFGEVYKGELKNEKGVIACAVKKVKEGATELERRDLINELNIMVTVGEHPNIVSLLGACTAGEPILVVVRLAENGCLLDRLKENRANPYVNVGNKKATFTETDKVKIARDVANGMLHLSNKVCVHRDLAARNVLLDKNNVAMVSDFGMSRDIYESGAYEHMSGGMLPVRWMALESIEDFTYNVKTDVWAFGVVLWEIASEGKMPYSALKGLEILDFLNSGQRLKQPEGCSDDIYQIMVSCWKQDPLQRPSFGELVKIFDQKLQTNSV